MPTLTRLLERVFEAGDGSLTDELSRYLLSIHFTDEEHSRYEVLAEKAQEGTLTAEEESEIDDFLTANSLLMILKSKARRSLAKPQSAA